MFPSKPVVRWCDLAHSRTQRKGKHTPQAFDTGIHTHTLIKPTVTHLLRFNTAPSCSSPSPTVLALVAVITINAEKETQQLVCVYYCRTCDKAVCGGGGGMCYEVRRAESCVEESAHHALVNARERDIV